MALSREGITRSAADVGRVQQIIEAIERLQGKQGHVGAVGHKDFEPRPEGPVAAEG
jgi:DNA-binding transcriptional regulator YbjK